MFEALADIDTKYAKIADKEYDGISAEVKKWFKKLAVSALSPDIDVSYGLHRDDVQKEERQHDGKVASANGRIKQAGMYYERKVKKNPADAVEEHARYINLLTTLGQETNQEK